MICAVFLLSVFWCSDLKIIIIICIPETRKMSGLSHLDSLNGPFYCYSFKMLPHFYIYLGFEWSASWKKMRYTKSVPYINAAAGTFIQMFWHALARRPYQCPVNGLISPLDHTQLEMNPIWDHKPPLPLVHIPPPSLPPTRGRVAQTSPSKSTWRNVENLNR